jgi:ankyrin repeat protein
MVRLLLEAGVNHDKRDERLNTPLYHAVRSGSVILVYLLCTRGAQKTYRMKRKKRQQILLQNLASDQLLNTCVDMNSILISKKSEIITLRRATKKNKFILKNIR